MIKYNIRKYHTQKGFLWALRYKTSLGKWERKKGFPTQYEAELWIKEYIKKQKARNHDKKLTIAQAASDYLEYHAKIHCSSSTYQFYESKIRCHIVPIIGHIPVNDLTPDQINEFMGILKEKNKEVNGKKSKKGEKLSPRTINHVRTILECIYNYLIQNEKVAKTQ